MLERGGTRSLILMWVRGGLIDELFALDLGNVPEIEIMNAWITKSLHIAAPWNGRVLGLVP
jgi:hypothetical protein